MRFESKEKNNSRSISRPKNPPGMSLFFSLPIQNRLWLCAKCPRLRLQSDLLIDKCELDDWQTTILGSKLPSSFAEPRIIFSQLSCTALVFLSKSKEMVQEAQQKYVWLSRRANEYRTRRTKWCTLSAPNVQCPGTGTKSKLSLSTVAIQSEMYSNQQIHSGSSNHQLTHWNDWGALPLVWLGTTTAQNKTHNLLLLVQSESHQRFSKWSTTTTRVEGSFRQITCSLWNQLNRM